jgi:YVTN family beta-propeller protein
VNTTLGVGTFPFGSAITPDGSEVVVANFNSGTVSIISGAESLTPHVTSTLVVGGNPTTVSISPDGTTAYVITYHGNSFVVISGLNTANPVVSQTLSVSDPGADPVTPDGDTAYVSDQTGGPLAVIHGLNSGSGTVTHLGFSFASQNLWLSPDGTTLYGAGYGSAIQVLTGANTSSPAFSPTATDALAFTTGAADMVFTADGTTAYVSIPGSNTVQVISGINTASPTLAATLPVGTNPGKMSISPDGATIYVAVNNGMRVITGANTTSPAVSPGTIPVSGIFGGSGMPITPDGTRIYAIDGAGKIDMVTPTAATGGTYTGAATATSGLAVAYTIDPSSGSGVCTISGGVVSFLAAGTCVVDANQAGDATHAAAPQAQLIFAVSAPATSPVITNLPASGQAGQSFTATVSTNGDGTKTVTSSTPAVCTVGGAALTVTEVAAGTCTLVAHVSSGATLLASDGAPQSFTVSLGTPGTPTISNVPLSGTYPGSGFTAILSGTSTTPVGNYPYYAAVDPATDMLYETNYVDNTVSVINGATNAVVATIPVGNNTRGIAVDPATDTIYVANFLDNTVSVINGATNTVTATLSGFNRPLDVAVDPTTDKIYVTNYNSDVVSVINGAINAVTATVTVGPVDGVFYGAFGVDVDPVTNTVYVANQHDAGGLYVINGATNTVTTRLSAQGATFVAVNPTTDKIYVTGVSNEVTVVNGANNTVANVISVPVTGQGVAVNANSDTVYVVNGAGNSVSLIDGATSTWTSTQAVGNNPFTVAVNQVTGEVFVTNSYGNTVTAFGGHLGDGAQSVSSTTPSVCTTSGLSVTYVSAGSCTLTALIAAGNAYAASSGPPQSFPVLPAPGAPTIENLPSGATYGGSFSASFGATSGPAGDGTNSIASSTPSVCTTSGTTVNFVGVGTCTITPSVGAGSIYGAATGTAQSFTVGQASQSITFNETAANVGHLITDVSASSGLAISYSIDPTSGAGVCSASGGSIEFDAAGTCVVDANQSGNADYLPAPPVQRSISVIQASQTITFNETTANVGQSSSTVASASSGLPISYSIDSSSDAGVCSVSGGSIDFLGAGTCVVDASQSGNADFLPAPPVQQSISVTVLSEPLYGTDGSSVYQFYQGNYTGIDYYGALGCTGQVVTDSYGDVFVNDPCYQQIVEFQAGSYNPIQLTQEVGLYGEICNVQSIAVDPGGDLFIEDRCGNYFEIPYNQGYYQQLNNETIGCPGPMAADAAGDLFVADNCSNTIFEWNASYDWQYQTPVSNQVGGTSLNYPQSIAVDAAGNIFATDNNGQVIAIPANGSPQVVVSNVAGGTQIGFGSQIAIDTVGNLFVYDASNYTIVEIPANGGPQSLTEQGNYVGSSGLAGLGPIGTFSSLTVQTPTSPTLTNAPTPSEFGASFVAQVTTSSDGTSSVTSSTPSVCTVGNDGLTVSFVGVGTCTLTPQVAATSSYAAATGAPQSFPISALAPTVSYAPAPLPYGAAPTAAQLDATASVPGSFTYDFSAVNSGRHVGTYTVTAIFTPSNPDYATTPFDGSLAITPAPLVVLASSSTSVYGAPVPAVTPNYAGFDYSDSSASFTTAATCTTSASASTPAGTYATSCSGAVDPDYSITYVAGSATVSPAPLTITASSPNSTYGSAPPAITAIYTGLVNGDTAPATSPTCVTSVTKSSPATSYSGADTCAGASDPNYTISYVRGTLVQKPANVAISASGGSFTYGGTVPTVTASYTTLVNGDTAASLSTQPTCTTTVTMSSPAGNYATADTCTGAVDPNYVFSYSPASMVVVQAPLVVTASSGSSTYGSTPSNPTPSYTGLVNGDTPASLTTAPVCSTTANASTPAGSYPTSCSGAADANYAITYASGGYQITPASLLVIAPSFAITYGGAIPAITPSYSGFVNGDTAAELTTSASCSTTATGSSPVGQYATSCSGASDPNYAITYAVGTLGIGSAVLTITASSSSSTYGSSVSAPTASYSGFQNGDTPASLTTQPVCSTTVSGSTTVGVYAGADSCSGAVNPNYAIAYVGGTASITPAALVVTASSDTSTYGSSPSSPTPSYSGLVNGDTAASLTSAPVCSTTVTSATPAGSDPGAETCAAAADANYAITYVPGDATVTPATLVLTASSPSSVYGAPVPAITPSYLFFQNGDTPASLTTQPVCSTFASTALTVGHYTTSCSGATDPNYRILVFGGTASITPAALVVTASSESSLYGQAPGAITATYSGLVNGDTAASLTSAPVCSTTVTSATPAGSDPGAETCAAAADANYAITYVPGDATVTPATLVLTASSPSSVYGAPVPAITPSYLFFQNGDTPASLTTQPVCSTFASTALTVGHYTTSCSGATDPNYRILLFGGTASITPAALVVTASSDTSTYGSSPSSPTPSYSGLVNGDTAASLTSAPVCSTTVTSATPAGSDPGAETCAAAADANYAITYVPGDATVTPATLVLTASSPSSVYGAPVPAITPSYLFFQNGDTPASLTTQPVCSTFASTALTVGHYTTSCSGATDPNYRILLFGGTASITPAALVVTASSDTSTYGSSPSSPTPTYSGLVNGDTAASLTSAPVCSTTVTSATPAGSDPGAETCAAAADANYAITYVPGDATVTPATLVLTASSPSSVYGAPVPAITPSYLFFQNGDTPASLTTQPVCSTFASTALTVGHYTTSCSGATDPNYRILVFGGTASITPAALVVTASSESSLYGQAPGAITATYSGLVNGDTAASLTTQPVCSTTATSTKPVGSYPSSCSGAVDPNYSVTYLGGNVTVASAALTITASSSTSIYGSSPGAITPSYSGFVNGDTAVNLTASPICSTTVTPSSPAALYGGAATCAGAVDPNYSISYAPGSSTVNPKGLVVAASSPTSIYGAPPGAVTPSYSGFVNGDTSASLTTQPVCSTTATSTKPVGSYPSSCAGAISPNYAVTYVSGSSTVTPASLVVTATSESSIFGQTPGAITPSYAGFVNGDTLTSLTTAPVCSTTATSTKPVGSYPSSCVGAVDPNYAISYVSGTVQIGKATPTLGWVTPAAITYGTKLSATQLNPTSSVPGTFTFSSPLGTLLGAGTNTVTATFTPTDAVDYASGGVVSVSQVVNKAVLTITASSESSIFGQTPGVITASYAGFVNGETATSLTTAPVCSTTATSAKPVGSYPSSCVGAVDPNYAISYVAGSVQVQKATPTLGWVTPAAITYGTKLSATQLNATSSAPGTFTYSSPLGTAFAAGGHTVTATFTPTDATDYTSGGTIAVNITVTPASLVVTATSESSIFGQTPGAITPSYAGFVNGDTLTSLTTAPVCSTTATSTKPVGSYPSSCVGAVDPNYAISYVSGTVQIGKATPTLGWVTPAAITYGTKLSATQLNPTSSVPGTFTFSSPLGTLLGAGTNTVTATFTPTDAVDYASGGVVSVSQVVNKAVLTITAGAETRLYGAPNPTLAVTYASSNPPVVTTGYTGAPLCSTTAVASSVGGTYPITCVTGPLASSNYTFAFVPGVLTVTYTSACFTGIYVHPITVAAGQSICIGPNATVLGTITVQPGGALDIEGATILGRVLSTGATDLRVCDSWIAGEISATWSTGLVTIGDANQNCGGDNILGLVTLTSNTAGVEVADGVIYGKLTITNTTGVLPPPEVGSVYTTPNNVIFNRPCDSDGDWDGD